MQLSLSGKFIKFALPTISLLALGYAANADDTMTFDGLANDTVVGNYYNGGGGPNYGVSFSSNGLALQSGAYGNNPSGTGILYWLSGSAATMDVAGGFKTDLSFYYASTQPVTIDIYSGLDGTGSLLASQAFAATPSPYYVWDQDSVSFAGTAESAVFAGADNFCGFDNVTITPATSSVPESNTLFSLTTLLATMGGMKLIRDRRKKNA